MSGSPTESAVLAWGLKVGNNVVLFNGNVDQFPGCFHICDQGHICGYYDELDIEMPIVFAVVEFL